MITYEDAVTEARRLVKRSEEDQWRLAELTWEQVESGKSRRRWALDIGVDPSYAERLYKVWTRWSAEPLGTRPRFPDAYGQAEGRPEDPSERTQAKAAATIRNLSPERQAQLATELLDDPEVAALVVNDAAARLNVRQALNERYENAPKPYEGQIQQPPPQDHAIEVLVRLRAISSTIKAATDVILSGPQVDGADDLLAVIDWQINALGIMRTALTGRADVDAELARILENGS